MQTNEIFEKAVTMIEQEYEARYKSEKRGWSFLYTPKETLGNNIGLMFAGLNPAGSSEDISKSVENGNAYIVQRDWKNDGTYTGLQLQIQEMYKNLSRRLGPKYCYQALMHLSLAANICPFRSKSWKELPYNKEASTFSKKLWSFIFVNIPIPSVIINISKKTDDILSDIFKEKGFNANDDKGGQKVGWGKVTYDITLYSKEEKEITVIRIPHLSRYRIFGRKKSQNATNEIVDLIASKLCCKNLLTRSLK